MSASSSFPRFFTRVEFGGRRYEVALAPASEGDIALVRSAVAVAASARDLVELLRVCPISGFCGMREIAVPLPLNLPEWEAAYLKAKKMQP